MHSSTKAFSLVGGASLGAGLMFFLDPDRGKRRRALMRDQGVRWSRKTREFAGSTSRDVQNRTHIFNHMKPHHSPDIPALQGPLGSKRGPRFTFMQSHWSPTARTAAALMGSAALFYGLSQRTVGSTTLAASGLGLLVRSATNQKFTRLLNFKEQGERQQLPKAA
jgi:hypothetical protein